jgi:histidine triad (HIT) family protein
MEDCIFCKMIMREILIEKIYEDEKYLAFLDINPMHPGHTLLIPKKHVDYIFDLEDEEFKDYFLMAKKLSFVLKEVLKTEKVGLAVEGFLVRHAHIHLVPLNKGQALDPCLQKPADKNELKKLGEKIRIKVKKQL